MFESALRSRCKSQLMRDFQHMRMAYVHMPAAAARGRPMRGTNTRARNSRARANAAGEWPSLDREGQAPPSVCRQPRMPWGSPLQPTLRGRTSETRTIPRQVCPRCGKARPLAPPEGAARGWCTLAPPGCAARCRARSFPLARSVWARGKRVRRATVAGNCGMTPARNGHTLAAECHNGNQHDEVGRCSGIRAATPSCRRGANRRDGLGAASGTRRVQRQG
jgi:hypothetical protein